MDKMIWYCFVSSDLDGIDETDPLYIQARYAKALGRFLLLRFDSQKVLDKDNNEKDVNNLSVFVRTTCLLRKKACAFLSCRGAVLTENDAAVLAIQNWDKLNITKREIIPLSVGEACDINFRKDLIRSFDRPEFLFLKTREKGFSLKVSTEQFLNEDGAFVNLMRSKCPDDDQQLLVSPWITIKKDSLGPLEIRCFVIDGEILNVSRIVHSVRHAVPRSMQEAAHGIVKQIISVKTFPTSFVLDLGMFCMHGSYEPDIIEINPVSVSMCYVNNSIFDECLEECLPVYQKSGWGYEYCYDMLFNPSAYHLERVIGYNYLFEDQERYVLL